MTVQEHDTQDDQESDPLERKLFRLAYNSTLRNPRKPMRGARKPMNKMSKKRAKFYRDVYEPLKKELLGGECEAKIPNICTGSSEHLHEIKSRARFGLENAVREGEVIPVCDFCNAWISENPLKAKSLGLLKSNKNN